MVKNGVQKQSRKTMSKMVLCERPCLADRGCGALYTASAAGELAGPAWLKALLHTTSCEARWRIPYMILYGPCITYHTWSV